MPKRSDNPRYNVISLRVTDETLAAVEQLGVRSRVMGLALEEYLRRRQDEVFRAKVYAKLRR